MSDDDYLKGIIPAIGPFGGAPPEIVKSPDYGWILVRNRPHPIGFENVYETSGESFAVRGLRRIRAISALLADEGEG